MTEVVSGQHAASVLGSTYGVCISLSGTGHITWQNVRRPVEVELQLALNSSGTITYFSVGMTNTDSPIHTFVSLPRCNTMKGAAVNVRSPTSDP